MLLNNFHNQKNVIKIKKSEVIRDFSDYNNAILEAEMMWGSFNTAAMRAEHEAILTEDSVLLEGVVSEYWEKVKEFFKKVWAAIKQFISNIWMRISVLWKNKAEWVAKYSRAIEAGSRILVDKEVSMRYPSEGKTFAKHSDDLKGILLDSLGELSKQAKQAVELVRETAKKASPEPKTAVSAIKKELEKLKKEMDGKNSELQEKVVHLREVMLYEVKTLSSSNIKDAIVGVKKVDGVKKAIKDIMDLEKTLTSGTLQVLESGIASKGDSTDVKLAIDITKLVQANLSKLKSFSISKANTILSTAFAICKKAAFAGAKSTKEAWKSGKTQNESVLAKYM